MGSGTGSQLSNVNAGRNQSLGQIESLIATQEPQLAATVGLISQMLANPAISSADVQGRTAAIQDQAATDERQVRRDVANQSAAKGQARSGTAQRQGMDASLGVQQDAAEQLFGLINQTQLANRQADVAAMTLLGQIANLYTQPYLAGSSTAQAAANQSSQVAANARSPFASVLGVLPIAGQLIGGSGEG